MANHQIKKARQPTIRCSSGPRPAPFAGLDLRPFVSNHHRLAQIPLRIPEFLIDSAPRLEIPPTPTQQTTKLFLIETETATFCHSRRAIPAQSLFPTNPARVITSPMPNTNRTLLTPRASVAHA